ncbi:MAG: hypothetical protein KAH95_01355 [Spirochaetales bacterium]|nr:hypothetical protein [Bacteroidales bacterium]MCK5671988.1 hypothetical protein [Spirochaetales bacterium]
MESWKAEFFKGKKCIISKDLRGALKHLHSSIKNCPVEKEIDLADIFFNLGITFRKLGFMVPAVRSWDASKCADKRGPGASVLDRIFPEKRLSEDKQKFYLIQLSTYLSGKKSGKIESEPEKDMIIDLIDIYWEQIIDSGILYGQCQSEKMIIFRDIEIDFPYIDATFDSPESENDNSGQIIPFKVKINS